MTRSGLHFSHRSNGAVVSSHIRACMNMISNRPSCVMCSLTSGLTLFIKSDLPFLRATEPLDLDLTSFTDSSLPRVYLSHSAHLIPRPSHVHLCLASSFSFPSLLPAFFTFYSQPPGSFSFRFPAGLV